MTARRGPSRPPFSRPSSPVVGSSLGAAAALAAGLLAAVLAVPGHAAPAGQRGQPAPLPKVMQIKLDHAQAVLEALATADFAGLERAAGRLGALTEQAEWGVLKTPEYARHSREFLQATTSLVASARAGDLNGAALDYAAMTFRCVQCHQHVKGVRAAE